MTDADKIIDLQIRVKALEQMAREDIGVECERCSVKGVYVVCPGCAKLKESVDAGEARGVFVVCPGCAKLKEGEEAEPQATAISTNNPSHSALACSPSPSAEELRNAKQQALHEFDRAESAEARVKELEVKLNAVSRRRDELAALAERRHDKLKIAVEGLKWMTWNSPSIRKAAEEVLAEIAAIGSKEAVTGEEGGP